MSAGADHTAAVPALPTGAIVYNTLELLAPKFRVAVLAALAECQTLGVEAVVYETYRTNALAQAYYAKGRTAPGPKVTNAPDNVHSWHGFGLAVDVIHRTLRWDAPAAWWQRMGSIFKAQGCSWGGDWHSFRDLPHIQWGGMPASPDDHDRELLRNGGTFAVWQRWGAV